MYSLLERPINGWLCLAEGEQACSATAKQQTCPEVMCMENSVRASGMPSNNGRRNNVREEGLEPSRPYRTQEPESCASANSATRA